MTDNLTDDDSEPESHCSKTCSASSYGQELARLNELACEKLPPLEDCEAILVILTQRAKQFYQAVDLANKLKDENENLREELRSCAEENELLETENNQLETDYEMHVKRIDELKALLVQAEGALDNLITAGDKSRAGITDAYYLPAVRYAHQTLTAIRGAGIGGSI